MLIVQRWGFKGPSNRRRWDTHFEPDGVIFWTYLALPSSRRRVTQAAAGWAFGPLWRAGWQPARDLNYFSSCDFVHHLLCRHTATSCDPPRSFP